MFGFISRTCQPIVSNSTRSFATVGKHFANQRRVNDAAKAAAKVAAAEALANKVPAPVNAKKALRQEKRAMAEKATQMVSAASSKNLQEQSAAMEAILNSTAPLAVREYTQVINMVSNVYTTDYKLACRVFQKIIENDYVPERSALTGLLRVLENSRQWKAANKLFAVIANLYPLREVDAKGNLKPVNVLSVPLDNVASYADIAESENTFEELEKFMNKRNSHGRPPRYETLNLFVELLLERQRYDEATKIVFQTMHRAGVCSTPEVPAKFSPINITHSYHGTNTVYKMPYALYYRVASYLESQQNYSAAMQIYIYMRSFSRYLDVTPSREIVYNDKVRDFADLHTMKPVQVRNQLKHLMREARLRYGYKSAVLAKASGIAEAKTYLKKEHLEAGLVDMSPLVNTKSERLVLLCDRSYSDVSVRAEKAEPLADYVLEVLGAMGIKARIEKASIYSSNEEMAQYLTEQPEEIDTIERELLVSIEAAELERYAKFESEKLSNTNKY